MIFPSEDITGAQDRPIKNFLWYLLLLQLDGFFLFSFLELMWSMRSTLFT